MFPPTCFDLYKVIITDVYTKAYKYSKFSHRSACVRVKIECCQLKIYFTMLYFNFN
jgi:hypothetical protein